MRTFTTWSDKIHDRDGVAQVVYSVAFKPDGTQLLAAAGAQVLVYKTADGELIQSLKGHKDTVYCVDFAADGTRFASGGADKTVIIWSQNLDAVLKYTHSDHIQAIAHNPVTGQVASCSASDFGLWSSEQTNVTKYKMPSKILSCSWTPDGQYIAFGLFNGNVSIRNRQGEEKVRVERGTSPVWSVCWNPGKNKETDVLAVADWNQKLSFFQLNGRQVGKDRSLDFDPCCVSFFSSGDYLLVGGSSREVTLWTWDGTRLGVVCMRKGWVWCCKVKPNANFVAVGCQDGTITMYQIVFNTVHGLYHDRYAYRENMTDVVIQHLSTDQRARIKCRDYVKKIAVYRDRLAVQLPDRVIVYELFHDDATDMHYRIKEKLHKKLDCNLLVVTAQHIILCIEKKLQMFNFTGEKEREWNLESLIRYIKVIGGQKCREGLLIGLKNGQILHIFIDNAFPVPLLKQNASIRCLDLSMSREKLAVVDEQNTCSVYDIKTRELQYQEPNANSVAWNTEIENMLCYSGGGQLSVKVGNHPAHQQKLQGFVVGFKGSKVFCLNVYSMTAIDIPQSAPLSRYLEKKEFKEAYDVACLDVTESDWRRLATESLENLDLEIAKKAFARVRDLKFIDLVSSIERQKREGINNSDLFLADIHAYEGHYQEAGRLYKKAGYVQKAIDMFTELNMWEYATKIAQEANVNIGDILKKKAQMQQDRNDLMAAAQTYIEVGDYDQAIEILGQNGGLDKLIEVVRSLNKLETKPLNRCAYYFRKHNHHAYAAETLAKMGNSARLLDLHIELQHWDEGFKLVEVHPELKEKIYLPYANWLALNDRFVEAQAHFRKAGRLDEAVKVLERLMQNAVTERRFNDASYYCWLLASEHLEAITPQKTRETLTEIEQNKLELFRRFECVSALFYAYHHVYRYLVEPFTPHHPESLFNMGRFILHQSVNTPLPGGISQAHVLFALVKQARNLGAFKLARQLYDRLSRLNLPVEWQNTVDVGAVTIRGKPLVDKEELFPVCYCCGLANPLLNVKGPRCVQCQHEFIVSMYSFETLPLVEFVPEDGISEDEAQKLIDADPPVVGRRPSALLRPAEIAGGPVTQAADGGESGGIGRKSAKDNDDFDPLASPLAMITAEGAGGAGEGGRLGSVAKLSRSALLALSRSEVYVRRWPSRAIPPQYFRTVLPDVQVAFCKTCRNFFHQDDYEFLVLQEQKCPFCRTPVSSE